MVRLTKTVIVIAGIIMITSEVKANDTDKLLFFVEHCRYWVGNWRGQTYLEKVARCIEYQAKMDALRKSE